MKPSSVDLCKLLSCSLNKYATFTSVRLIAFNIYHPLLKADIGISCLGKLTQPPGPEVIKLCSCSALLSMEFQLLIETKFLKQRIVLALKLSDAVFILLIHVKMPTIVGILTFMSWINSMLS